MVVGKWYSPFMFIKEGTLKDQISTSTYYEVTLEQKWEQIFACENNERQGNVVVVDVVVPREMVLVAGREVMDVNGRKRANVLFKKKSSIFFLS